MKLCGALVALMTTVMLPALAVAAPSVSVLHHQDEVIIPPGVASQDQATPAEWIIPPGPSHPQRAERAEWIIPPGPSHPQRAERAEWIIPPGPSHPQRAERAEWIIPPGPTHPLATRSPAQSNDWAYRPSEEHPN